MAVRDAMGPDGRLWTVRREWLHRAPRPLRRRVLRRKRQPKRDNEGDFDPAVGVEFSVTALDAGSQVPALFIVAGVVAVVVAVGALAWFFILPALVFLADVLFLVVTAAIAVAIRVLFRRPWDVIAETTDRPPARLEFPVAGYGASGRKVAELVYDIQTGREPFSPVTRG
jgi:hypothetical protein